MHHAIRLHRIRQSALAAAATLILAIGLPAAGEEPAAGERATSGPNPNAMGPAAVSAARAPSRPGEREATAPAKAVGGMIDEMPPAALAPAEVPDPVLERMRAEQDLKEAHARLQEADRDVSVMLRRNYPRGDPRASLLAKQTAAERSFHEAQSAVDHLDSRDGW
jgi:hypothetical protein